MDLDPLRHSTRQYYQSLADYYAAQTRAVSRRAEMFSAAAMGSPELAGLDAAVKHDEQVEDAAHVRMFAMRDRYRHHLGIFLRELTGAAKPAAPTPPRRGHWCATCAESKVPAEAPS